MQTHHSVLACFLYTIFLDAFKFLIDKKTHLHGKCVSSFMERVMGIEPTQSAWKAEVLPLNYTCTNFRVKTNGARGRSRTGTDFKVRRILSPVRLPISPPGLIQLNGDPQATRTPDPLIKSQMLYQLSQRVIPYGWGSWIRTSAMTESKSVALPLGYTPFIRQMVERSGFEPPNQKELSYSQPRLATSLPLHHGAG